MAPRRKSRANVTESSTPAEDDVETPTEQQKAPSSPRKPAYDPLKDLWSTEQETALFKGLVKYKPSGMHKHFRMIALAEHLRTQGWDSKTHTHTRIPAVWEKLATLYNLEAIDEIDNSFDSTDEETGEEQWLEFALPQDEYGEDMWHKGIDSNAHSSPAQLNRSPSPPTTKKRKRDAPSRGRASTIDDTDEPMTSPVPSPMVKSSRSSRGRKGGSKAEENKETVADTEDQEMEDVEDQDDDDEQDEEEGEDEDEDEDEEDDNEEEEEEEEEKDQSTPVRSTKRNVKATKGSSSTRAQGSARKSSRIRR